MKKLFIFVLILFSIISCEMQIDDPTEKEKPKNVVLYNGSVNDTSNLVFNKNNSGLVNEIITVQFYFSDPVVFTGLLSLYKNSGPFDVIVVNPGSDYIVIKQIDLTTSDYFTVDSEFENDPAYDGRDINCTITWIK